jgi:para-aminobenzoate synthetase component 1
VTPERVFAVVQERPGAVWLDGTSGWSILAWDPVQTTTEADRWQRTGRAWTRDRALDPSVPFSGGVLGYVGYGGTTEEPPVWLSRYDGALCFDHTNGTWHAAGVPAFVSEATEVVATAPTLDPVPPAPTSVTERTVERTSWLQSVQIIQEWIRAGDCYQVNLTRPVWVDGVDDAWAAYRRLRHPPSAYGAFLRLSKTLAVLSHSPELLLEVRGRRAASVPIKGTRPRGTTPEIDAALRYELLESDKERAELTMIVDLVRNDLSRVAELGSVRAAERVLTAHPTVHHASWRVEARLQRGADAWAALDALFPAGSITGAPKQRARQRIAELEPWPRGVYCGAIGYAADGGNATFNVAIRTAVVQADQARYHVGGGIVIGSDPEAEWAETEAKAAALRAALVG